MRQVPFGRGGGSMEDTVDRVIACCENVPALEQLGRQEIRIKLSQYLGNLASAGHRDPDDLALYGLAYLRALYEPPDPHYTGC
jgi:hypothetical protein